MTPEDIENDEEIHKLLDNAYITRRFKTVYKALIKSKITPTDAHIATIGIIIRENNERLLKVFHYTRH